MDCWKPSLHRRVLFLVRYHMVDSWLVFSEELYTRTFSGREQLKKCDAESTVQTSGCNTHQVLCLYFDFIPSEGFATLIIPKMRSLPYVPTYVYSFFWSLPPFQFFSGVNLLFSLFLFPIRTSFIVPILLTVMTMTSFFVLQLSCWLALLLNGEL